MKDFEIEINADGFTSDASYRYPVRELCNQYQNRFPDLEKLIINVHEKSWIELNQRNASAAKAITISPERKIITISKNVCL